ncbi:MAG: glycerophosphodiester phosphodiesterase family protein [Desulfobacterales bacterium]|jgi:glycerophosphoryl diester phosphodiesterase
MKTSYWFQSLQRGREVAAQVWLPMSVYLLVVWLASLSLLSPLTSWALGQLLTGKENLIVGNSDLIAWLISPRGLLFLILSASFALLSLVLQVVGLIWIARHSETKGLQSVKQTVIRLSHAFAALYRFCLKAFLLCIILLVPMVVGLGTIYYIFLSKHDINFYLTAKPPIWYWALVLAGLWMLIWTGIIGGLLIRWIYLLPLWLDGIRPFKNAMISSWRITKGVSRQLLFVISTCMLAWILVQILVGEGLLLIMGSIASLLSQNIWGLFVTICLYLLVAAFSSLLINFFGSVWTICTLVACYQDHADLPAANRPPDGYSKSVKSHKSETRHPLQSLIVGLILVILAAVGIALSWWFMPNRDLPSKIPEIIAHRAGAHHAPENTLAALEMAIGQKADAAEIDVQRTLDGTVVVVHDQDLMKLARDPRRIDQTTYQDLSGIDIGSLFHPDFKQERIAKLSDFLSAAAGKIRLLIELKYYGDDKLLAGETLNLVRRAGMEEEVQIMSLDLKAVKQMQQLAPQMATGYVFAAGLGNLAQLDVAFLAVSTGQATSKLMREAHERGLMVYAWTVNDVDGILDMMEVGIDGLITDDPALAIATIQDIRQLTPMERLILRFRHLWD